MKTTAMIDEKDIPYSTLSGKTSSELDEEARLRAEKILLWASREENLWFDTGFVKMCSNQYNFSLGQRKAVHNIYKATVERSM